MRIIKPGNYNWQWWRLFPYWRCDRCEAVVEIDVGDVESGDVTVRQWDRDNAPLIVYYRCPSCNNLGFGSRSEKPR